MNLLFVCTGNTCRSAMAEALARKIFGEAGLKNVSVSSCGTAVSPVYKVPPVVFALMAEEGIDMSGHRPEQISEKHVESADLILVMDNYHKQYITSIAPGGQSKVFLLKEYLDPKHKEEIPDPIGCPEEVYRETKEELKSCISRLVAKLK